MSRIIQSFAAAAMFAALLTGAAQAGTISPSQFEGVVIVPASANPMQQEVSTPRKTTAQAQFKRGKIVAFKSAMTKGSILVNTSEHALYYILGNGKAVKYRVATAKPGFEWSGTHKVSAKQKWPSWRPPTEMRQRRPDLPAFMAGGAENPLGARALYLGSSIYRIHGTNEPKSIGKSASSGCIRMLNADVTELYQFVKHGATVTVF